jgi:folate-binding protein YgfZ
MAFVTVLASEEEVFLHAMPGQAAGITRYLNSMIFWQDEATVADLSAGAFQFALYGPRSDEIMQSLAVDISLIKPYGWRSTSLGGVHASVHRGGPLTAFDWLVDVAPSALSAVHYQLSEAAPQLGPETVDLLRIEAGLPLWGRELSEQVTPLETGLLPAISFNKGCYTGQEVIARQTNYDKVTRNLVGLEMDQGAASPLLAQPEPAPEAAQVASDGPWGLVRGPGRGGFVGSVAYSPRLDRIIALAVVPRDLVQPGLEVEVVRADQTLKAIVRDLPFVTRSRP